MASDGLGGRTALITGGSRGIGAAISRRLAEAGAAIAINYRERAEPAESLADELRKQGATVVTVPADVSQTDDVRKMVQAVTSELGGIHGLDNNAGIAIARGIDNRSEADFDLTIAVNLKSVFLCTQAVLPMMRAKNWGRIINISSGAAPRPRGVRGRSPLPPPACLR